MLTSLRPGACPLHLVASYERTTTKNQSRLNDRVQLENIIHNMNCPSRTDEPEGTGFNQSPNALAADLTTRQDLNGRANSRVLMRIASPESEDVIEDALGDLREREAGVDVQGKGMLGRTLTRASLNSGGRLREPLGVPEGDSRMESSCFRWKKCSRGVLEVVKKFGKFIGPGFMVRITFKPPADHYLYASQLPPAKYAFPPLCLTSFIDLRCLH